MRREGRVGRTGRRDWSDCEGVVIVGAAAASERGRARVRSHTYSRTWGGVGKWLLERTSNTRGSVASWRARPRRARSRGSSYTKSFIPFSPAARAAGGAEGGSPRPGVSAGDSAQSMPKAPGWQMQKPRRHAPRPEQTIGGPEAPVEVGRGKQPLHTDTSSIRDGLTGAAGRPLARRWRRACGCGRRGAARQEKFARLGRCRLGWGAQVGRLAAEERPCPCGRSRGAPADAGGCRGVAATRRRRSACGARSRPRRGTGTAARALCERRQPVAAAMAAAAAGRGG